MPKASKIFTVGFRFDNSKLDAAGLTSPFV
jgi:hypothetical protein